jgi:hypothetical protein
MTHLWAFTIAYLAICLLAIALALGVKPLVAELILRGWV